MSLAGQWPEEKQMMLPAATTLAQGDLEVVAGRRAALGGIIDGQKVGTRDEGTTF